MGHWHSDISSSENKQCVTKFCRTHTARQDPTRYKCGCRRPARRVYNFVATGADMLKVGLLTGTRRSPPHALCLYLPANSYKRTNKTLHILTSFNHTHTRSAHTVVGVGKAIRSLSFWGYKISMKFIVLHMCFHLFPVFGLLLMCCFSDL